jgi:DNA-binding response OmpR family regulator
MHILVVEDERTMAQRIRRVLSEERHNVDVGHDERSVMDVACSDTYDLVILDLMLPEIDGLQVCRQLRANGIKTSVMMLKAHGAVEANLIPCIQYETTLTAKLTAMPTIDSSQRRTPARTQPARQA